MIGLFSVLNLSKTFNYQILHYKVAKNLLEVIKYKMKYNCYAKIFLLPLIIKTFRAIDFNLLESRDFKVRLYPSKYFKAWIF